MRLTCFIRYELDPFKRQAFERYAEAWAAVIPRCGGELIGYFVPHEGSNFEAWGLIAFASLAEYERYRARLKDDPDAQANFAFAERERFILKEERRFNRVVGSTFMQAAAPLATIAGA